MTGSLDLSAHYKRLSRAEKQGELLADSIQSWAQQARVRCESSIANDRMSWELRLRTDRQPLLDTEWNFIFSEAVHNLRSALDNAVVAIGRESGTAEPKDLKRMQFPISKTIADWRKGKSRIDCLPQKFRAAIEGIQPFNRSTTSNTLKVDPLLTLRDLSNKDKHHLQVTAIIQPQQVENSSVIEFEDQDESSFKTPFEVDFSVPNFSDGELILLYRTDSRIARVSGAYNIGAQVQVTLEDGKSFGLTFLLAHLCVSVREVLDILNATGQS